MNLYGLTAFVGLVLHAWAFQADPNIKLGFLQAHDILDGCGGYFYLPKDSTKALILVDNLADTAWLNINGLDTKLELVRSTQKGSQQKLGDKFSEFYRGGGFDVEISFTITFVCPPGDESCEYTGMDGIVTVRRGSSKSRISIAGGRGC